MREIVLDTETTGLNPATGDKIVEIGCVELINYIPSGNSYHVYISPEREVPQEAFQVHGLSTDFLADKPVFKSIAKDFLDFIDDSKLIIHNASFDISFINAELEVAGYETLSYNRVLDTLQLARQKLPGMRASLDALCAHFNVDSSRRTKHGALLDSELLAEVYLELIGGKQASLDLASAQAKERRGHVNNPSQKATKRIDPLKSSLTSEDQTKHNDFIATLGDKAIWQKYL